MRQRILAGLVVAVFFVLAGVGQASADLSRAVKAAFSGQFVVTRGELREGKNDKDSIAQIKAERLQVVVGESRENVVQWHFHYTAFLTKGGASSLKLEYYLSEKDNHPVTTQTVSGVDPKADFLEGNVTISEDDKLQKGKTYLIKVVASKGQVVASGRLTFR